MASIIPGYEYDIFISYRQKDNLPAPGSGRQGKGDRWVSEFVDALKTELESTFKEEISVYFDINPHDGLLETHDVEASLKDKLRCLIFIPIISRTYCDPKSFAWEHEFKAFIDDTLNDRFGLKIRLPNGNVAGRVLPVRIYDLDSEDISLCESLLGGPLRSVDFIYKSAGVNRPLRADEEHPQDNLNKTYYRDQVNKIANSIKEIIAAIQHSESLHDAVKKEPQKSSFSYWSDKKSSVLKWVIVAFILILCGTYIIQRLFKAEQQNEKSIAVLPFLNDSPSDSTTYFINGVMEEILTNLQKIKDFRVLSRTSTEQYRGSAGLSLQKIAKNLDVNYIVEGSGQKYGNTFRLRVQLIEARNEKHLWAGSYEKEINETKDIYGTQSLIAQSIAAELKATITPVEKQLLDKTPTRNLSAYYYYQRAQEEFSRFPYPKFDVESNNKAAALYHQALRYDSTFALAYVGLANLYWARWDRDNTISDNISLKNRYLDSLLILSNIALSYDDHLAEAYYVRGGYFDMKGDPRLALGEWNEAIKINPNYWTAYQLIANRCDGYDMLKALRYMHKAVSLNHGPELPQCLENLGWLYFQAGFPEKGKYYFAESFKLDGDSLKFSDNLALSHQYQGDYTIALDHFKKRYLKDSTNPAILNPLAVNYLLTGNYKEALVYFKKYISASNDRGMQIKNLDFPHIGYAYYQNGNIKKAKYYYDKGLEYYDNLKKSSISADVTPACLYACTGDKGKAIDYLRIFGQTQYGKSYMGSFLKIEPTFNSIRNEPEFLRLQKDLESKCNAEHEKVRKWLEEQ